MSSLYSRLRRTTDGPIIPRRTPQPTSSGFIPTTVVVTIATTVEGPTIIPYSLPAESPQREPSSPLLSAVSSPMPITPDRIFLGSAVQVSLHSTHSPCRILLYP